MKSLLPTAATISLVLSSTTSFSITPKKLQKHHITSSSSFGVTSSNSSPRLFYSTTSDSDHDITETQQRLSNLLDGAISLYSLHSTYTAESGDDDDDTSETQNSIEELIDATASALHATFEMQRIIELQNLEQNLDHAVMSAASTQQQQQQENKDELVKEVTKLAKAYHANSMLQQETLSIPMVSPTSKDMMISRRGADALEERLVELTRVIQKVPTPPPLPSQDSIGLDGADEFEIASVVEEEEEEKEKDDVVVVPLQDAPFSDFATFDPATAATPKLETTDVVVVAEEEKEKEEEGVILELDDKTELNDEDAQKLFEEIMGEVTAANTNTNTFESLQEEEENEEKKEEQEKEEIAQQVNDRFVKQQPRFDSFSWIGDLMGGGGGGGGSKGGEKRSNSWFSK